MSLANSPVGRRKQNAVIKLHCLLTAVSFSFALLPSSLVAFSSPALAQPMSASAKNFNVDAAGILIAAKGPDEVKAPSSGEVSADSEASESSDKDKDKDKKSNDKKAEDKKSKAKDTKASAKEDKAKEEKGKDDKAKDDKSKSKDEKTKAEKSKDDKAKDKKADAKADNKKEDSKDDKKKASVKRGFFGRAKEDTAKAPAAATPAATSAIAPAAAPAATAPAKASEKKEEKEEKSLVFEPDTALISVLKDLNRSLKESDEISKIEDANQRMIVTLAAAVIDKALSDPKLAFNRILAKEQEGKARTRLTAESWSSGDVEVNDKFKGSLSTVWAKRIDGLVTVTVAGDCHDRKAADGKDIGEFIVVINARSPVETGFDIQSQANVNFWIGKLGAIMVEADCIPKPAAEGEQPAERKGDSETQSSADQKKKSIVALPPLLTHRYRHYYELIVLQDDRRRLIAQQLAAMDPSVQMIESEKIVSEKDKKEVLAKAEKTKVAKVKVEAAEEVDEDTKSKADADSDDPKAESKSETKTASNKDKAKADEENTEDAEEKSAATEKVAKAAAPAKKEPEVKVVEKFVEKAPEKSTEKSSRVETVYNTGTAGSYPVTITTSNTNLKTAAGKSTRPVAKQDSNTGANSGANFGTNPIGKQGNEMAYAGAAQSMERITGLELPALKQPKNFTMLMPDRALAGQPVTVAFVDEQRNPESNVELSFNGVTLSTDQNGQAQYMIPEDETPGRSLNIALLSRPYEMPAVIEVLQPLATPSSPQAPKVDRASHLVSRRSNLVIDGHNFDGVALNNRVIIDGMTECTIAAASPVQLKVTLPKDLRPGPHSLCVSTEGMRSNPIGFELAQLEVVCEGKDNPKDTSGKVTVKVVGTTTKVNVKLVNLSPDLIRLNKGDDAKLLSSGGADNTASVSVQRLKKGPMKVEAWLEL